MLLTERQIHGSQPNRSTRRRCGLAIRYIPTWVKPEGEDPKKAILVRGENRERCFADRPLPFPLKTRAAVSASSA